MTQTAGPDAAPVPDALAASHAEALRRFAAPGTWLEGATRVAIVEESRRARSCGVCRERREALSPASVAGDHETATDLPAPLVELAHRLTTDPGRSTAAWTESILGAGVTAEEYVEAASLVSTSTILDTFSVALGRGVSPLPAPLAGEPSRTANPHVVDGGARVPIMDPERPTARWGGRLVPNICRALALVPASLDEFWDVFQWHYRPPEIAPGAPFARAQMEFTASRVSALNECFY